MLVKKLGTLALFSSVVVMPVYAQYSGPTETSKGTVASIIADPVDDQEVIIQGNLLRKTGHDKYVFSDGTGEIVAEIKEKRFPKQPVNETTKVELMGEVDTGFNRPPEIEVDSMRIVE